MFKYSVIKHYIIIGYNLYCMVTGHAALAHLFILTFIYYYFSFLLFYLHFNLCNIVTSRWFLTSFLDRYSVVFNEKMSKINKL